MIKIDYTFEEGGETICMITMDESNSYIIYSNLSVLKRLHFYDEFDSLYSFIYMLFLIF